MTQDRPPPPPGEVEDFTAAFLVSFGVLVFMALFAVWAAWGLPAAILAALAGDRLIGRP